MKYVNYVVLPGAVNIGIPLDFPHFCLLSKLESDRWARKREGGSLAENTMQKTLEIF